MLPENRSSKAGDGVTHMSRTVPISLPKKCLLTILICVFIDEPFKKCQYNNFKIKSDSPVFDVI